MTRRKALAFALLAMASIFWGVVFPLAALALRELTPMQVVSARFLIATLVLLPFMLWRHEWPQRGDLPLFLLASLFGVPVAMLFLFTGIKLAGAVIAALLLGAFPVLLSLSAIVFEGERLGWRAWAATFTSVAGVALITGKPPQATGWLGPVLVLASLVCFSAWVVMSQRLMRRYSPFSVTSHIILFGTLMLLPLAALDGAPPELTRLHVTTWLSLLGLGVLCTALTYQLWNWGLREVGTHTSGVMGNLEPLTGAVLGVLMLGEPVNAALWVGGALILCAALSVSL